MEELSPTSLRPFVDEPMGGEGAADTGWAADVSGWQLMSASLGGGREVIAVP